MTTIWKAEETFQHHSVFPWIKLHIYSFCKGKPKILSSVSPVNNTTKWENYFSNVKMSDFISVTAEREGGHEPLRSTTLSPPINPKIISLDSQEKHNHRDKTRYILANHDPGILSAKCHIDSHACDRCSISATQGEVLWDRQLLSFKLFA